MHENSLAKLYRVQSTIPSINVHFLDLVCFRQVAAKAFTADEVSDLHGRLQMGESSQDT